MLSVIWGDIGGKQRVFPSILSCATLSFSDATQCHFPGYKVLCLEKFWNYRSNKKVLLQQNQREKKATIGFYVLI